MKIVDKISVDPKGWWLDLSSVNINRFESVRFISDFETNGKLIEIVDAKAYPFGPESPVKKNRAQIPRWLRKDIDEMKNVFVLVEEDDDGNDGNYRFFLTKTT